jgi:pterin-4a-carbinolamine dehydratase
MPEAEIFISYRRESTLVVDHVHQKLGFVTADGKVFLDREDIQPGAEFPERLRSAMSSAHLVLAFIGKDWISVQDPVSFQRRLDMPLDWVRLELEQALQGGKKIIPVLIEGAAMPLPVQLPETLRKLVDFQSVTLSIEGFSEDVAKLVDEIERQLGADRVDELVRGKTGKFPPIPGFVPQPLDSAQLATLQSELPQWKLVESELLDDERFPRGYKRLELVREFRFAEFRDAVLFMAAASKSIDTIGHHPRWENVFCTVTVHFSTWDIGHRPSDRDHRAAKNIEREYEEFMRQLGRGIRYEVSAIGR